ncbi:MAG TPA: retropepsin-like aspartic protease [Candidatus Limnocylindria bacterium]|nr:retropepsin-like aspartic protease [Candidatus Limnocylindria bacterium]
MDQTSRWLLVALVLAAPPLARAFADGTPETPVRLVQSGRGWVLDARVNDHVTGRFLLDTGATSCVITPLMAGRLGLFPPQRHIEVDTAAGTVRAGVVRLQSVAVGPRRADRIQALVLDGMEDDLDGVIGLNFLDQFTYAIDPRRGILELR